MIHKLKKLFPFGEVDLSRRKFIKTGAQLAALAVVASASPIAFNLKTEELEGQILRGLVENQTFYIDKTIVIDIPNVTIYNCRFIATRSMDVMIEFGENAVSCIMSCCRLDRGGFNGICGLLVRPQEGDMTRTLQSAVDLGGTIRLSAGEFKNSSPLLANSSFTGFVSKPLEGSKTRAFNLVKSYINV